ncbi:MAG: hypothetical protein ACREGL_00105, partial [Alphaproteobacteria bacterium]
YALAAVPARYALEREQWVEAAALTPHPDFPWAKAPQAEAVVHFARALGAARGANPVVAKEAVARLGELRQALIDAKQAYWAGQVEIQAKVAGAWLALAEGRKEEALAMLRNAADAEDATEKHAVTPGPLVPARELLGAMLLELDEPAAALKEFEASHTIEPNRFHGLAGAARAAERAGDRSKAKDYYTRLVELAGSGEGERAALVRAKEVLATQ